MGKLDAVVLSQHLGQVLLRIEAGVLVASQLDNTRRGRRVHHVLGRAASIAVNQASHSFFAVGPAQALELPRAPRSLRASSLTSAP